MKTQRSMWPAVLASIAVGVFAVQCSMNPATGKRELNLVSEAQEIAVGRDADPQIVAQFGLYPDDEMQRYVDGIGQRLAAASERPDLAWTFRVLDDPLINAFALPGGYIYVTRGILAHFGSEAELAGVLGHEIGHVTARHGASQMSKALLAQIGLIAGAVAAPEAAQQYGGLAQQLAGLLFLKFGRDDERQADQLAVRYSYGAGFDPNAMIDVFATLDRASQAAGAGRLPGWASTHPSPEDRTQRLAQAIDEQGILREGLTVGREGYVARLDEMVYGEDPRQGYFRDQRFYHPDLAFQLELPADWPKQNTRQAVVAVSRGQDAIVELQLAAESSAEEAERRFFSQSAVRSGQSGGTSLNGLSARQREFAVVDSAGQTAAVGVAAFVEHGGRVFRLLGYQREGAQWASAIRSSVGSFARLTDRARLDVQAMRLDVVRARGASAFSEEPAIRGASLDVARLALLNGVDLGTSLSRGAMMKTVIGSDPSRP
jgi:predicted Zn-dependent protease